MRKPVIGILGNIMFVNEPQLSNGQYKAYINQDYIESVRRGGGIPLIIPVTDPFERETLAELIEKTDGLLLPGGDDVAPYFYHENPHPELGYFLARTDRFHIEAVKIAREYKKPVLGICRGLQVINVALGGTLYQDLPSQKEGVFQHQQKAPRQEGSHYICVKRESFLSRCFAEEKVLVNSHHHQAVRETAPGFSVIAETADGVVEAIEKTGEWPVIGVQWHPEAMTMGGSEEQQRIFEEFMKLACNAG